MPEVKACFPASPMLTKAEREPGVLITIFHYMSLIFLFGLAFLTSTEYSR